MGSGGSVTPNYAAGTFTLNAAATVGGSVIQCTVTNALSADLAINKSGTTSTNVGSSAGYTLTVWNMGPSAVQSSTVADTVSSSFLTDVAWSCQAVGSASCGVTTSGSGNNISVTTGALPVNATASVPTSGDYLVFSVSGLAATIGSYSNTATVTTTGGVTDSNAANNTSIVSNIIVAAAPASPPATCSVGSPLNLLATTALLTVNGNSTQAKWQNSSAYAAGFMDTDNTTYTHAVPLILGAAGYMVGTGPGNRFVVDLRWNWSNGNPESSSTIATLALQINGIIYAVMTTTNGDSTVGSIVSQNGATVSSSVVSAGDIRGTTGTLNPPTRRYVVLPASVTSITSVEMVYVNDSPGNTKGDDVSYNFDSIYVCPPTTDLSITKTGPAYAKLATDITYSLTVKNETATAAAAYSVTDVLPAGTVYVSSSSSGVYDASARTVTWSLTSLAGSATQALSVVVITPSELNVRGNPSAQPPAAPIISLSNSARVNLPNDPVTTNNTSSTVVTQLILTEVVKRVRNVTSDERQGPAVELFSDTGSGQPGEILEYCLTFRNLGGVQLGNYLLTDNVPANINALTAVAAYGGQAIRLTRGGTGVAGSPDVAGGTVTYPTAAATDTDQGSLTTTGSTTSMTIKLDTPLLVGKTGRACFRGSIR